MRKQEGRVTGRTEERKGGGKRREGLTGAREKRLVMSLEAR